MSAYSNEHGLVPAQSSQDAITAAPVERVSVQPKGTDNTPVASSHSSTGYTHGPVEMTADGVEASAGLEEPIIRKSKFGFLTTKQFWILLLLSQTLAVALTGTATISSLLILNGAIFPAFQVIFNYLLLNLIYTSFTIYKIGIKAWLRLLWTDGWKFFILAFCDVEGNYFTIYAYSYTNLLSVQLISFWAVATVVIVSFIFLKVRYNLFQYLGILVCLGGLGLLIASDRLRGASPSDAVDPVKGDLFALLGATFYGLSNVYEEFMVSKRPLWMVVGQLAFWGLIIDGVQIAIFERDNVTNATWDSTTAGYLVGFTLILTFFYSGAPILFRMSSAAFFNIGLLTANFWNLIVGLQLFQYTFHFLYPVAFVLILIGHLVYYGTEGVLGEARKPWLGQDQAVGVAGIGTAKRRLERPGVVI